MPGLPPSLKVYLKKKKYICLPFFSREERKVKRENSREYRPFLMAVIDPICLCICDQARKTIQTTGHWNFRWGKRHI